MSVAILIGIALAVWFASVKGGEAQSVDVRLGFDGVFVHGRWSPVRIDVSPGAEPFAGRIEIEIPRTTLLSVEPAYVELKAPVAMDSGATKRLWLSVPLQATPYPMSARLVSEAGEVVSARQISLKEGAVQGGLTLVLDPSGERWSWLSAAEAGEPAGTTVATAWTAADLPSDPLALSSLSSIVISDDFPVDSLSPAQLAALRDYVRFGGHLVFTGGSTAPSLPGGLSEWLPFPPTGRIIPIASGDAQVPAWQLDAPPGAVARYAGEAPLIVGAPVGAGRVTYIAVDPVTPSSRSLLPLDLWTAGLLGEEERPWVDISPTHQEEIWRILGRTRIETAPPLLLASFLGAYVAAMIAALFFARKSRLALWAIPCLILAGSAFAWIVSAGLTGSNRMAYAEFQVVQEIADGVAVGRSYGIVASGSPVPLALDVKAATSLPFPGGTGREEAEVAVTSDGIRFEAIGPGESVRIMHEALEPFPVRALIDREDRSIVRVENRGEFPLRFAYLVGQDWFTPLGTIEAGGSVTTQIPNQVAQGSSSFVTLSIQSHLERLDASARPSSQEARLISFAVGQALDAALYSGKRDVPLLVALAEPVDLVRLEPAGRAFRRRVIIAPFAEGIARGAPDAG